MKYVTLPSGLSLSLLSACLSQVVMVAVPTVLGIASIRVYTVSEAPADGLVPREKVALPFNISPPSAR